MDRLGPADDRGHVVTAQLLFPHMIDVSDFVSVHDRASDLGCNIPATIAVMPYNFDTAASRSELRYRAEAATVKALLKNNGVPMVDLLPTGERVPTIHNKNFDWSAMIFVSGALLTENPNLVSVALGVLSNYLTDYFKGLQGKKIKISVIVEKSSTRICKKVTYEGDIKGLESIHDAIKRIADE